MVIKQIQVVKGLLAELLSIVVYAVLLYLMCGLIEVVFR